MNKTFPKLALLSVLFATLASAATIYTLSATVTTQATVPNIIFTTASDTSSIGGSVGANGTTFTASAVPLGVGANVTISQAVGLTNRDAGSARIITAVVLLSEDFGSSLSQLSIYAYNGARTLLLSVDGSGTVTYQFSGTLSMPASAVWSVIIEGCYDAGTVTTSNTIAFNIEQ